MCCYQVSVEYKLQPIVFPKKFVILFEYIIAKHQVCFGKQGCWLE